MVYTLRFFSSKCSLFHNSNLFSSCIIHILYTGCAKIKKNNSGPKRLNILICIYHPVHYDWVVTIWPTKCTQFLQITIYFNTQSPTWIKIHVSSNELCAFVWHIVTIKYTNFMFWRFNTAKLSKLLLANLTAYRNLKSPVVYELKSTLINIKDLLSQDLPIQQDTASETAYGQTRRIFPTGGTATFRLASVMAW